MSIALLLIVIGAADPASGSDAAPPGRAGMVLATSGAVLVDRGGQTYRAMPRGALEEGDRLETAPGGGTSLLLGDGQMIYLGPEASVAIQGGPDRRILALERGEVRATVGGDGADLSVVTPAASARVEQGILRARADGGGVRFRTESGSAVIHAGAREPLPLPLGQQLIIPTGQEPQGPTPAEATGWAIRVDDLQLAAAAAASRRLKRGQVDGLNDQTALDFGPSGQFPPPSGPPGTEPSATGPATPADPATSADPAPATPDEPASPAETAPTTPGEEGEPGRQPIALTQPAAISTVSLALGSSSAIAGIGSSGGLFSDAQQDSRNPAFPGNIFLVAAETSYLLRDVPLVRTDYFPDLREYWSIGLGDRPTEQVVTTFRTGSDPNPVTLPIPRTGAYLVQFPQSQYGIPDPATPGLAVASPGIAGLLGADPPAPQVRNADPLLDTRPNVLNDRATFALGEFALQTEEGRPRFDIRRGDQDRLIIKSTTGNDLDDVIIPNEDVTFVRVHDPRFFPELPTVEVPSPMNPLNPAPRYGTLDRLRKAAATTLLAEALSGYAARTGRTRYVIDGRVVDISGYRPRGVFRPDLSRGDFLRQSAAARRGLDLRRAGVPGPHRR